MSTATQHKGCVKQVLSGDTLIIRDRPRGGPPPERTVGLSNVTAPRLGRRPPANTTGERFIADTKDEPYAWQAREFLRKRVVGQNVSFTVEHKAPSGKEYGVVMIGKEDQLENLAELMVMEGLAEVRRQSGPGATNEQQQKLVALEEAARTAGKGKWAQPTEPHAVRNITWTVENPVTFVEARHGKPVSAVIEHVRDGCTFRAFLLPDAGSDVFYHATIMLSGVKTPTFRLEAEAQVAEPYAEEARYFVETRLLQREVELLLETSSNQNLVASVMHPNGNIAHLLLKEGFARCIDWSMGVVSQKAGGPELYRGAEREAKEKRLRLWKDYQPVAAGESANAGSETNGVGQGKSYSGKVVEVGNGDNLTLKCADGQFRKFFLASVRPPRPAQPGGTALPPGSKGRPRPLYDIPYLFEAREFLRKKLVGKKVNIRIDYIQPKNETGMEDRVMATVQVGDLNVAEALVSKGLATVVRYRASDENRSSSYDALLAAEAVAQKKAVGVHSKKEPPTHKINDLSGDANKSKQFLPFLKRGGRLEAVVEYVASGSRVRLFVPKETCLITFLCAGIDCVRGPRRLPSGTEEKGDPFGADAYQYTRELVLQREVEMEVETMDKGGNFIGWLFFDPTGQGSGTSSNLSVQLVENGFAKVHFTAERSNYYSALSRAEDKAREERLHIWSLAENLKAVTVGEETTEEEVNGTSAGDAETEGETTTSDRKTSYKGALVTVVAPDLHFFVQYVKSEEQLTRMSTELNTYLTENPPLGGAYQPKTGDLCAAKFVDDCWYRAKVMKVVGPHEVHLRYIDFGNSEVSEVSRLGSLPSSLSSLPPQAQEMRLACVQMPPDEEDKRTADFFFSRDVLNKEVRVNIEQEGEGGVKGASILLDKDVDEAEVLLRLGYVVAETKRDRRLRPLITKYNEVQEEAKRARRNIWRYGDFREDDM